MDKKLLREVVELQRDVVLNLDGGVSREGLDEIKFVVGFSLIISGIRRCGKSIFLRQLLERQKNFYYLNLEDPRLDGFDLSDFNRVEEIFKEVYGKAGVWFLDEVQNIPKWELFVRYLVDKKELVVLTGSNASLLSRELGSKLTGRHLSIEMFPFSYNEFLKLKRLKASKNSYEEYLFNGGFPEFLKSNNSLILNELLNDVIMRDIVNRFGIRNSSLLRKMAVYLISHVGKEFSYNSLGKMFQVKSVQSVIDYISYFEDAYILFTVSRFSYSYKSQQISPKKVYSIDNGFSSINSVSFSKDKGRMLENSVFLFIRRKNKDIFYFQNNNRECDFIIKDREKVVEAIQVCYDLNEETRDREVGGLVEAMEKFGLKEGLILTMEDEDEIVINKKKIKVLPVWKWMGR